MKLVKLEIAEGISFEYVEVVDNIEGVVISVDEFDNEVNEQIGVGQVKDTIITQLYYLIKVIGISEGSNFVLVKFQNHSWGIVFGNTKENLLSFINSI